MRIDSDEPTWTPGGGPPGGGGGRNPGGRVCLLALFAMFIDLAVLLGGIHQVAQGI